MPQSFLLREASWVFGEQQDAPLQWAAAQAMQLAKQLIGTRPRISSTLDGACAVIVGSPAHNSFIREAHLPELEGNTLGPDDYLIRTSLLDGKPVVYIAGNNDRAAMYGLFAFFEALGCKFLLSRDVLPATDPELSVPTLDITGQTACPWRGVWISFCFATTAVMSLSDYADMFDQLAKMRMNRVIYYHFENEPFIDYSYAGERKVVGDTTHPESACFSLGRQDVGSYRVEDMVVGQEVFDREYVAPREFQGVKSSAKALDTGKAFMQELIRMAKERGIGSWISFDSAFIALNFAKYMRLMPRPVELYAALVSFTDPVVHEINRNRIENIITSYPELEGIFFQITEGFYEDRYPESQAVIAGEWPQYQEALALLREHWGKWWVGEEIQETCIRADIGFVELLKHSIAAAKELKPDLPLGVLTVCKAYLLTHLHAILPKDMPFVDIEAQSLWTVDGAPLHLFQRMEGRECALVPRAYDDGSLAGLQCNLQLYQRDGFLASQRANGTSGLVIQVSHITGNDHNVRFLAEGMWDDTLTPEGFYHDYTKALFGEAAAPMVAEAFALLEENEVFLGGRGFKNMPYTFTPPEVGMLNTLKAHDKPFLEAAINQATIDGMNERVEKFLHTISLLQAALAHFTLGATICSASGRDELEYLIKKTRGYIKHLETLMLFHDAYVAYATAFGVLEQGIPAFREQFRQVAALARRVEANAIAAAEAFAACAVHPTDRGVVWMMNKTIHGARVLRQYLDNILAYFEGREYWAPVDWEMLTSGSPYRTYRVEEIETLVLG